MKDIEEKNHRFEKSWALQQYSDVGALLRSKLIQLLNDRLELIFHARLLKTNRFSSFRTKLLEIFFKGKIWISVEAIFFEPSEIGVLGLTWRVTLL